jgi:type IV secretion system protein VirB2
MENKTVIDQSNASVNDQKSVLKSSISTATMLLLMMTTPSAFAGSLTSGGSGMPWEDAVNTILTSIQGPIARAFILIAIIVTGIMMSFGDHGAGFKKVMGIAFGGSIIVGITSFVSTLFGAGF